MALNRNINGMLTMPAALKHKQSNVDSASSKAPTKPGIPRLRLIIRRLPPGLTQAEFESTLDHEWQVGAGRVDWLAYKTGKISTDPSKPSRPSRAYLRVKEQSLLDGLSTVVKQASFQDARNTGKDPCLLGPPSLEFAPYGKVTGGRMRRDGRQGTIDQDPEFIDFLQSLTEPAGRPNGVGESGEPTSSRPRKLTTTPLVEFLKEKKANKSKENTPSKNNKSQLKGDSKEAKIDKADTKKVSVIKKEAQKSSEKIKIEKATQDAVKNSTKSGVASKVNEDKIESGSSGQAPASTVPPIKRERDRGAASVAARMLQRDLGLTPRGERRTSRGIISASKARGVAEPEAEAPQMPTSPQSSVKALESSTTVVPVRPDGSSAQVPSSASTSPTGPRMGKAAIPTPAPASGPTPSASGRSPPLSTTPTSGAKSAFLKHANVSQGVTEDFLHAAFAVFGEITRCEIDRKKGFGYVDFQDIGSLQKAIAASPVKVGEKGGQVVVLENRNVKTKPQLAPQPSKPTDTKTTVQAPPARPATSPRPGSGAEMVKSPSSPAPPTAPRGAHVPFRGGSPRQASRRENSGPARAGFGRGGRSGRSTFRGRGAHESNRRGSPASGKNTDDATSASSLPSAPTATSVTENKAADPPS